MTTQPSLQLLNVRQMPLSEWLALLSNPPGIGQFVDFQFPTDQHREEYLASVAQRPEGEVLDLLRHFLIPSGSLGIDELRLASLSVIQKSDPEMFDRMLKLQYYKRLILKAAGHASIQPWEGITWVLELLPHFPKEALEGLNAYVLAHIQLLPDGRINGLYDAIEVIRAKFIGLPGTQAEVVQSLLNLSSRNFESIVERLYDRMGYSTGLTPPQKDGGRDVIAVKQQTGHLETLRIECKRYRKPVGVGIARALLGVVSSEKATKGVLVTPGDFTSVAREFARQNPRLELINGDQFARLMNEHHGLKWPLHIDRLVLESQRKYTASISHRTSI